MTGRRSRLDGRFVLGLTLLAGVAAVVVAMTIGLTGDLLLALAGPPPIVRAGLAGASIVIGARMLIAALRRIAGAFHQGTESVLAAGRVSDADLGAMTRGVRLVFLAAAAFTAAAGWLLAEPLPLVIALVIAGVDVVETSFLLLVATRRG